MELSLKELTDKVLALPLDERIVLAHRLWDSIEGFIEPGIEEEWLNLAEQRWQEIKNGSVKCFPAAEAMKKAKTYLR